ncbi:RNA-guided endonuclease TnpB family protein [Candidatus Mycobacterium methanotrophicum]|uniref:RNA-guided endonuclease TnpB family protein n=1 Tax=Candidatus Mycobacterium methanotrophicum TaxID=2943498 RepID=A0ABY4QTK2_9MYCO|nr:RNA-guided endonuclease TnpB family protein [Candidatus Mycobacterium methanotrophicum]UQX13410.1 RNA-guided endonuclease TnpB family protein [Candidatus Mycobacterium methanotrophicum]
MAHRYRMYPTAEQSVFMLERHCADARFVWNLAVEQFNWGRTGRPAPVPAARQKQLAVARQACEWLAAGSSAVQQQALRDFDRAVAGFFNGVYRRPGWRRKHLDEGFCIRDSRVEIVNRKWAQVFVPKLGLVKFRLSRPLPAGALGMARVTRKAGRWYVAFPAPQPEVAGVPGREERLVGIDRGVKTTLALSDGTMLRAPVMRRSEQKTLARLQRQLARCRKGSVRRGKVKARIAKLHAGVADRRKERCIIRIIGLVDGTPTDFDGQYVVEYDPSRVGAQPVTGRPMRLFHLVTTPDIGRATRFALAEAVHVHRAVDRRDPTRADGELNRPLTAFTVDFEPATEVSEPAPVLPSAGWYVDPSNPHYRRWWDGTKRTSHTGAR